MVCSAENAVALLLIEAKDGGLHLAFVPDELPQIQVEAGLRELAIEAQQVSVVSDWRTASCNLAVAPLTFPQTN